jgi:23S rRNA (cytidine1920-2'-O)/16S rRNA (cytidine1409-2'-O)-methyltransferase
MTERKRQRLDLIMTQRGLVESRSLAQRLILAGRVRVNGETAAAPGGLVGADAAVEVSDPPRFVSRGGEKLEAALDRFAVRPQWWVCADAGASTGGFTDCLLQYGARKVYAVDVGKGILDWKLRNDPRVIPMEKTNVRHLVSLPEQIDLATIDVSFISLRLLFPVILGWLVGQGRVIALIKPQFEAGRGQVGKGGVVRDPAVHRRVLEEVLASAVTAGFAAEGLMPSPIKGPAGNIEFLANLKPGKQTSPLDTMIQSALDEAGAD